MVLRREHLHKVLSSYQHLGSTAVSSISASYNRTSVQDLPSLIRWFLLELPVAPVLLCFHVFFVAAELHKPSSGRHYWIKSLALTTFAAYGGATLSCLLSGAPPAMFTTASNHMLGYVCVAWWLVHTVAPLRSLLALRPARAVLAFGANAAKARSLFSFMDKFVLRYPGAAAGAIVLGGLAGSGGALFIALERKLRLGPSARSALSRPGWGFKSPYIAAALYYVLTDPDGLLQGMTIPLRNAIPRDDARFAISLALASHAGLEALLGRNFNPVYFVEYILYSLARLEKGSATSGSNTKSPEASSTASSRSLAKKNLRVPDTVRCKMIQNGRKW